LRDEGVHGPDVIGKGAGFDIVNTDRKRTIDRSGLAPPSCWSECPE
jgi:hypothetical protein